MPQNIRNKQIIRIRKAGDHKHIILCFDYDKNLIEEIKIIKGRKYLPELK